MSPLLNQSVRTANNDAKLLGRSKRVPHFWFAYPSDSIDLLDIRIVLMRKTALPSLLRQLLSPYFVERLTPSSRNPLFQRESQTMSHHFHLQMNLEIENFDQCMARFPVSLVEI